MRSFLNRAAITILALSGTAYSLLAEGNVKLSGTIANATGDSIQISYNDNYLAYYPSNYTARLDKQGHFSIEFPVPASGYQPAEIKYANHTTDVILYNGDSLVMDFNSLHFDSSIHYAGKGSAIQNFIALHNIQKGRMNLYASRLKGAMEKQPADFLSTIATEKNTETDLLNKHKKGLPASFISYWSAYYMYYNYFFMEQYPQMHEMMRLKRYTDTVPAENYSVLKSLPYAFNDSLLQQPAYLLYLGGIHEAKLKAAGLTYDTRDSMQKRIFADSIFHLAYTTMPGKSAEYFIAQNLYASARYQAIGRIKAQYSTFIRHWPQSSYAPLLDRQIALAERLAPGQPAPDFDISTPDGKQMKLSDFRGKVVYLGFWAGWCRQCVGEMISESKTKDVLKGKPVTFVYVSLDNDTSSMRIMRKYKIEGIFHFAEGGWNAKEAQLYGVQGMPAYYIIDKEGRIASQNAPSPMQSTELIVAISRLF